MVRRRRPVGGGQSGLTREPTRWWTRAPVTNARGAWPLIPDYSGANVRGIVPALLGPAPWARRPDWMPAGRRRGQPGGGAGARRAGVGAAREHAPLMPTLAALDGGPITTVAPTTTATALTSIATGLTPGEHGLMGYRIDVGGEVLNVLRWTATGGDRRRALPPSDMQPFAPFLGHAVPVCRRPTAADRRSPRLISVARAGRLARRVGDRRRGRPAAGRRRAVRVRLLRRHRQDRPRARLRPVLRGRAAASPTHGRRRARALPAGAVLLVTADHGQVHVGDRSCVPTPDAAGDGRHAVRRGTFPLAARRRRAPPTTC